MTSSLRSRVVEAGAEAIRAEREREKGAEEFRRRDELQATAALDAFLDCLTENADEWAEETRMSLVVGGDALALVAVLREDR